MSRPKTLNFDDMIQKLLLFGFYISHYFAVSFKLLKIFETFPVLFAYFIHSLLFYDTRNLMKYLYSLKLQSRERK